MGNMSASSAHKMGVVALTLVTASNMMGSGVFMLPTNLAGVGYISLWGMVIYNHWCYRISLSFRQNQSYHTA
ncbi:Putrescine transport protein [Morganella morganii]|nr:Putrescine transport protein [Morganella morganii]